MAQHATEEQVGGTCANNGCDCLASDMRDVVEPCMDGWMHACCNVHVYVYL